ncbi:hypothetical protein LCGC14_0323080 [marine sediment metagenome]|uniref:Uncharacterized protein n=1 Tax=marine sediment metagenome TaxID=412755 RepID=A0A0F9TP36_9ZZZZ
MSDTKPCPECNGKMIQWPTGVVLCCYPPKTPWIWKCGCGHTEKGGKWVGQTDEQSFQDEWKARQ